MRVGLGVVVSVLAIGLRLAAASSRSSRSYSSYSSYSPSTYPSTLPSYRSSSERERELQDARDALLELRRSIVNSNCAGLWPSQLQLEVQVSQPTVMALQSRAMKSLIPDGTTWPGVVRVAGLEVMVLERRPTADEVHPTCLDTNTSLVGRVRSTLHLADMKDLQRVDGAVVVKTTNSTAAQLLLASDLKEVLQAKGPIVAFAGSDNLVALADSTDTKAVKAAALASARQLDTTGEEGCVRAEPLVLSNGTWSKWTPNSAVKTEVEAHRRAAQACLDSMLQDEVAGSSNLDEDVPAAFSKPATRRFDATVGSIARVSLDRYDGKQLVAQADQIELAHSDGRKTLLTWPVFQRATKKALTPVQVDGVIRDGAFIIDPEMVASLDTSTNATLKTLK